MFLKVKYAIKLLAQNLSMSEIDTHRLAKAARLIMEYEKRPSKADDFLETKNILSYKYGEERRICQFIFLTVLRNKLIIEAILAKFLKKTPRPGLFALLKCAAAEILASDESKLASIIHAWVETAKQNFSLGESKLANAILRKFAPAYTEFKSSAKSLEDFALLYSHPLWLAKSWKEQFGEEKAIEIMKLDNRPSDVFFRLSTTSSAKNVFLPYLESFEKTPLENFFKLKRGSFSKVSELLKTPHVYIQDPATRFAPLALNPKGGAILDLCAAPGGKSRAIIDMLLASPQNAKGASLVAVDIDSPRLKRLRENLEKVESFKTEILPCDLLSENLADKLKGAGLPTSFDYILLDAPCSNTGVLRRRPDARYRISIKDIENCKLIQIKLIKTATKLLKQGGRLVYSTCSIDKRENEDAPAEALKDFSDLRISSMKTHLPDEDSDGAGICVIERQI